QPPIRVLVVDDDEQWRQTLVRRFNRQGMKPVGAASAEEGIEKAGETRCDVAVLDLNLPGMSGIDLLSVLKERQPELEALMLTAHSSIETAVEAMKRGAYDFLVKPIHLPELEIHIQKAFEKVQLVRREHQWVQQLTYESPRYQLVGSSLPMQRVVQMIERVAPSEATILIRGASGTGKELVARAIHMNSPRCDRPIVTIN